MTATLTTTFQPNFSALASRLVVGLVAGVFVTAGLFWLMQYMLETADGELDDGPMRATLEFVRVIKDKPVIRRPPPVPPIKPKVPPEPPKRFQFSDSSASTPVGSLDPPDISLGDGFLPGGGPGTPGEGDYLPIVRVAPVYPRRALSQGVEGHCDVEFTVTRHGTVRDPRVIDGRCSSALFQKASLDAALKFKYKPRVVDGVALEVSGVQNRFTFRITE